MPLPISEQIPRAILARLERVTEANGCSFDGQAKRPKRLHGYTPKDRELVLYQGERVPDEEHTTEGDPPASARWQTYFVAIFVVPPDSDATPIETHTNLRVADVEQILTNPPTSGEDWETWGGLAIASEINDPLDLYTPAGEFAGAILPVRVLYRTPDNDPYTTR